MQIRLIGVGFISVFKGLILSSNWPLNSWTLASPGRVSKGKVHIKPDDDKLLESSGLDENITQQIHAI